MVSQKVYDLCHGENTVSSEIAKDPTVAPGKVAERLYGDQEERFAHEDHFKDYTISEQDLEKAYECGNWGATRPSKLFLQIFHDALRPLNGDPLIGMVSPPLMGSSGVNPLTIIGPLSDICRHMSNVIARAQKEVFLATNYWMDSDATHIINQGLLELSKRAGQRGEKVIVKIMYDRGNPKQFINNHQPVPEKEYTTGAVKLPSTKEIPNISLEVVNYHRPIFGTFHAKYMVADRRIAIISSNNIQDNDNVEMMIHLEGSIVDSFYDLALNSWHNAFDPPLPMSNSPASSVKPPSFEVASHNTMFENDGMLRDSTGQPLPTTETEQDRQVNSHATAFAGHENVDPKAATDGGNLSKVVDIGSQRRLPMHDGDDPHFDEDIAGEVTRAQSVLSPMEGETRMNAVTRHLNAKLGKGTKGDAPECDPGDEMITMIPLPAHDPVPMAMVCRKSYGSPNHKGVHNPQNEAFLSAVRNAERNIFIQTPNLNAEPLLPELIAACKRGIDVYYYICLGYNDAGELLPRQGGNNEYIANKLFSELNDSEKQHLHIFNYIAKDQTKPIHNSKKERSCHIKLLIADGHVGIQGNGNQDTQSWYHSLEANVMVDSATICATWAEGIRRNQNTHIYGEVSKADGCWHDEDGKQAPGAIGNEPGKLSWLKGITGAIARVRGAGGF